MGEKFSAIAFFQASENAPDLLRCVMLSSHGDLIDLKAIDPAQAG
jgi:hypothetical protein